MAEPTAPAELHPADEPPPNAPVYQMPDGGTMWGTWEADDAEQDEEET